jgi:FMN reductase (NADPH)/FMN reductase [NAD(P)H]
MNETLQVIQKRRSIRAYADKLIGRDDIDAIIQTAMRAPTAGNMMLYSILEIEDPVLKDKLAKTCDDQPFIAQAPLVLIFLADYQRWIDYFIHCGVREYCTAHGQELRLPGEGDLLLAVNDTLIAAQTAAMAAESLGIGSCYIGDVMENYEIHRELLNLPQYVVPVTMLCMGYPKESTRPLKQTGRFGQEFIHFKNRYQRLDGIKLDEMFKGYHRPHLADGAANFGQDNYIRKFSADFSIELTRSVRKMIECWNNPGIN